MPQPRNDFTIVPTSIDAHASETQLMTFWRVGWILAVLLGLSDARISYRLRKVDLFIEISKG